MTKLYRDYNSYLKEKFHTKTFKIAISAGMSCPNKETSTGCIYCHDGSAAGYINHGLSIKEQIEQRIKLIKKKNTKAKFIAYFQAFSNTYEKIPILKNLYDEAIFHPDVIGLSIGTRPDCVDEKKIKLIQQYTKTHEVWIEYGLQSINEKTLKTINRGHTLKDFTHAVNITQNKGINICAHIILGLPGETKKEIMETAIFLAKLHLEGIKIHLLHVIKNTPLHKMYSEGKIVLLPQQEYINLVCDILEILPPSMIIQRITGEADKKIHIAPLWALKKTLIIDTINAELKSRKSFQGKYYTS